MLNLQNAENSLHWVSSPEQFFETVPIVTLTSTSKQKLWSWRSCSTVFSFQDMETNLTGFQTHDNISEFPPLQNLFLASGNKHATFGTNRYISSRPTSGNTHTEFQFYITANCGYVRTFSSITTVAV
jgi:hypothetical protein